MKQRNIFQITEQDKPYPNKNLNEMDISSLPDKKFNVMVIKMLT